MYPKEQNSPIEFAVRNLLTHTMDHQIRTLVWGAIDDNGTLHHMCAQSKDGQIYELIGLAESIKQIIYSNGVETENVDFYTEEESQRENEEDRKGYGNG